MPADLYLSIVVPLQDDAEIVAGLIDEVVALLRTHWTNYELVLVDDGSTDETVKCASLKLGEHRCIRLLRLSRRFGQEAAILAGLESAIGDFVVVMDPVTDPVDAIPAMVERARAGRGAVFGVRNQPPHSGFLYRRAAGAFYWLANSVCGIDLPPWSSQFRVLSRQAVNAMIALKDQMRSIRVLTGFVGYDNEPFHYTPIHRGQRKRRPSLLRAAGPAALLLIANSLQPLRLASLFGLCMAGLNFLYLIYVAAIFLFKADVKEGWTTQSAQISVMFLCLFLVAALLAEYAGRLLEEVRGRPLFYLREERNSSVLLADETRRNVIHVQETKADESRAAEVPDVRGG